MGGKTLMPWQAETIRYILDYRLSSWFGTVCGKIDDTSSHQKVPEHSPVAQRPSVPQEKSRSKLVLAIAAGAIAGLLLLCCGASVIIPLLYYFLNF